MCFLDSSTRCRFVGAHLSLCVAFVALAQLGCSSPKRVIAHPENKSEAQQQADSDQCFDEAVAQVPDYPDDLGENKRAGELWAQCMKHRGYRRVEVAE